MVEFKKENIFTAIFKFLKIEKSLKKYFMKISHISEFAENF